ncbi:hypothetical protein [Apilactobacillus micheneri]|uniref:Cell division protein n=1 Tax=Apilactobacillus micheneri TaxID=1899430 RepID=A0A9Q8IM20_9LACO|nr:hypothetical protein [Apilactobacillus micheneri]TPR37624.1 hypothetical protein DY119_07340 [Apilactobacillus micheneri]TPR37981.1 hypothetical protein DY116_01810 [Apilactobacillus micheneri]TPR39804.1 hypothetical protein DY121_04645 [Apilactobacillus micheneri]TPR41443.1 hypothetical protein DY123_06090 [Apilactobacillus micheneri]TPR43725.1 hypothetical protein DY130_04640 [Apilactobacillus micheneri]
MNKLKKLSRRLSSAKITPFLVILGMALILLSRQIYTHSVFLGMDSIFHFNRFYDSAMQIRNGHFSYFQMNYGFSQSGRMINAVYGPFISYLSGLLLLLSGSWFHFQILETLLVLVIAGMSMYLLLIKNSVKRSYAILLAIFYMYSCPVVSWLLTQQFTGIGAAFMPLLILAGTQFFKGHRFSIIYLAGAMALMIQTHLMTSLIGFISLVPMFIAGFFMTDYKWIYFKRACLAAILCLLMTANIWGSLLQLFHNNFLMPVYPVPSMTFFSFKFSIYSWTSLIKPADFALFIWVLYMFVRHFKQWDVKVKTLSITGLVFFYLSTYLFPWDQAMQIYPHLAYNLQFPKRFLVLPFVILPLVAGIMMTKQTTKHDYHWIKIGSLIVAILLGLGINLWAEGFKSLKSIHLVDNQTTVNLTHVYMHKKRKPDQIKNDFYGNDLSGLINDFTKAVPDYLPVRSKLEPVEYNNLHPYYKSHKQLVKKNVSKTYHFVKTVNADGSLTVRWHSPYHHKLTQLPVIKYANTKVTYNGSENGIQTGKIGSIIVHSKHGNNTLTTKYLAGNWWKTMMWICLFSWIFFIYMLFYKLINRK